MGTPWYQAQVAVKGIWAALVALVLFASVATAVVRTVQLDGMRFLFIKVEGARPKVARLEGEIAELLKAAKAARAEQVRVNQEQEKSYERLADTVDEQAEQLRIFADNATERYIADNRVRACPRVRGGGTSASARREGTGVGEEVRSASQLDAARPTVQEDRVAVTASDVRICTANTLQAEAAREWAVGLEEINRASNP